MSSNKEFNVSLVRTAKHEEQICVRVDKQAYHAFMRKAMSAALGVEIGEGYRIEHQACDVQISWTVTKKDAVPAQFFNLADPFNKQTPSPSGEHAVELSCEEKLKKISEMYSSAHAFQTMIRIEPEFLVGKDVQLIACEGVHNVSISEDKDFSFRGQLQPGAGCLFWHYFNADDIEPVKDWDWTQKLKTSQVNALFTALK